MFYKNAKIYTEDFRFETGAFSVEAGRFAQVLSESAPADATDLEGAYVIPGLVDVHNHGNSGRDFSDGDDEGLRAMAAYLGRCGVTSFAPASMTLPYDVLSKAFGAAKRLKEEAPAGLARLMGIQMEGPFFSEKKKGAQNGAYLRDPDFEAFQALEEGCGGLIRIVDVAPELPGSVEFIEKAKALCTVSVAHTDASYDEAKAAFDAGATHVTHLYNAMPGIHHRKPGVIPAAVEHEGVRAELICDGLHVHPASVRLAFRMFGADRMILISDALRCCGMPDGEYELGGQQVFLSGGVARLADGTIAGSATNLFDCMRHAISFGIAPEDAIRAATWNPACALGVQEEVGSKGASVAAHAIDPDLAVALDVTHATIPQSRPDTTVPLDAPAATYGPFVQHKLLERLKKAAKDHGIKLNTEHAERFTYTDLDNIQIAREGVPCVLIDLPLKYMHTTVELLDMNVIRECGRLLAHFLCDLDEGWNEALWS